MENWFEDLCERIIKSKDKYLIDWGYYVRYGLTIRAINVLNNYIVKNKLFQKLGCSKVNDFFNRR